MTTVQLAEVAVAGARLAVPAHWQRIDPPAAAVVGAAVEPADGAGLFRANVTLAATQQDGWEFGPWQQATDAELPRLLGDYALIDLEHVDVAGHPGGRRLAHHVTADGTCVVMEQWSTVVADVGWVLTWTVDVLRYDEMFDVVRDAVRLLELPAGGLA